MNKQIIGRIELGPDGQQRVRALGDVDHMTQTISHQNKIRALIAAAEKFKSKETGDNLMELVEAARQL